MRFYRIFTQMLKSRWLKITLVLIIAVAAAYWCATRLNLNPNHQPGEKIDELNGVAVYYNGGVNHTAGRNLSQDGYNLGMKYQCVEFIKRYYYQHFHHKMPDAFGHAKSFFNPGIKDGKLNTARGLIQFHNGSAQSPQAEDIIVFAPWVFNPYGHVAIISRVEADQIEIIQQNPGPFGHSRETIALEQQNGHWIIQHSRALGWLRLPETAKPHALALR